MILTPTRELAVQIDRAINGYGRFTDLKALAVYGGVSINNQIRAFFFRNDYLRGLSSNGYGNTAKTLTNWYTVNNIIRAINPHDYLLYYPSHPSFIKIL